MKTADVDILIVPGWSNSGPDHWQSRWERNLPTARRVDQDDWLNPHRDAWVGRVIEATAAASRPVVIVAHSLGVLVSISAAHKLPPSTITGLFLVAPADVDNWQDWPTTNGHNWSGGGFGFTPIPLDPLPCPAMVVGSQDDPYCSTERAKQLAEAWGAEYADGGAVGHINVSSGHGPWPDGLLRFGYFLRRLTAVAT